MNSEEVTFILILPLAVIIAGVVIIVAGLRHRARMLELVHKERVAMIERIGVTDDDPLGIEPGARWTADDELIGVGR